MGLVPVFFYIHSKNGADDFDFLRRAGNKDYAVGVYALLFAPTQQTLVSSMRVHQHPSQSNSRGATLTIAVLDKPAHSNECLARQFSAVLAGHSALDAREAGRNRTGVSFGGFRPTMDLSVRPPAPGLR